MGFNIDFKRLKLKSGMSIDEQLQKEAKRFKEILQRHINDWYASYSPSIYDRTYNMKNSIFVEDIIDLNMTDNSLQITVKYSDAVYHDSLFEDTEVNTLYLMDSGYKVINGYHKNIEYFGYRSTAQFLKAAANEFNRNNYFNIKIDIIKPESIYR